MSTIWLGYDNGIREAFNEKTHEKESGYTNLLILIPDLSRFTRPKHIEHEGINIKVSWKHDVL